MEIDRLMEKIGLSECAVQFVKNFKMPEKVYQEWKELFDTDLKAFFEKGKETENFEQTVLYLYVHFAAEAWKWFCEEGISEEVYMLNMRDIAIWANAYEKKNGCPGLREAGWISLSLRGKLFRLGRLQFEPMELEKEIKTENNTYPQGMKVLNVHIPEDGKLSKDACQEAFEKAEVFFKDRGFTGENVYVCESWLLSPVLKHFLGEESNIIDFQNRFEVYDIVYPFRQAEERIFGDILEDRQAYPETTSLQRSFKGWLMEHPEDIGMGVGVFQYKEP